MSFQRCDSVWKGYCHGNPRCSWHVCHRVGVTSSGCHRAPSQTEDGQTAPGSPGQRFSSWISRSLVNCEHPKDHFVGLAAERCVQLNRLTGREGFEVDVILSAWERFWFRSKWSQCGVSAAQHRLSCACRGHFRQVLHVRIHLWWEGFGLLLLQGSITDNHCLTIDFDLNCWLWLQPLALTWTFDFDLNRWLWLWRNILIFCSRRSQQKEQQARCTLKYFGGHGGVNSSKCYWRDIA